MSARRTARGLDRSANRLNSRRSATVAAAVAVEALEYRRLFAAFTVDTTIDENDGNTTPGHMSLREAVLAANANPGADEIVLPAGTLTLSIPGANEDAGLTGDLDVTGSVTIVGKGAITTDPAQTTVIDAQHLDRVFDIRPGATVTLAALKLMNGQAPSGTFANAGGGGIRVQSATLNLIDTTVTANTSGSVAGSGTFGGFGGGISVESGVLNLTRTTVSNNKTGSGGTVGGQGGGISANSSTTTLTDSAVTGNRTGDGDPSPNLITAGDGGGIYNAQGDLTLVGTNVTSNAVGTTTRGSGGGIDFVSAGTHLLVVERGNVNSNTAYSGGGIAINASTADHITDTTFFNNQAAAGGGAILNEAGTIGRIERSTFFNNTQPAGLADPTVAGGGAIYNQGDIGSIVNSTFSSNVATGYGGAIRNDGDIDHVVNVTIASNRAADGGGLYHMLFANVTPTIGELTNTLIANNTLTDGATASDFKQLGAVTSARNNLVRSASGNALADGVNGNLVGRDPLLDSLRLGGGFTRTRALLAGSPAIDAALAGAAPATDQRGITRPAGAAADIGAYEAEPAGVTAPPVAVDKTVTVYEGVTVLVPLPYTDPDSGSLTPALVTPPANGAASVDILNDFVYRGAPNFSGTDTFTYSLSDGTNTSNVGTITVNVIPVTTALAAAPQTLQTAEDTPLTGQLTAVAEGPGGAVTFSTDTAPAHGSVTIAPTGAFTYTPALNFNGADTFVFRATRADGRTATATVSLTITPVNDAPISADDAYTIDEDTTLTISATPVSTLHMVSDPGDFVGQGLTYDYTTANATFAAFTNFDNGANFNAGPWGLDFAAPGNAFLSAGYYPGAVRWPFQGITQPGLDVSGNGRGENTLTGFFTVNDIVYSPDHTKVLSFAGSFEQHGESRTAALRGVLRFNSAVGTGAGVLANDSDAEGDFFTANLVDAPQHGSLALNPDGSFSYTPNPNFNGVDTFTYRATDGQLAGNLATVRITVNPVNDAPVAGDDAFSTDEDTPLNVTAPGLLANDTDVDGDPLSPILVAGPSHGTLALSADGSFTYTPAANYNGPDAFTYKLNDGAVDSNTATVNLTVNAVNDAPVALKDSFTTPEDTGVSGNVLTNDSDVDSPTLTAVLVAGPSHGTLALNADGSFVYTPAANFNGADSFTYRATDGSAQSNITAVNIAVTPVNDAPVARDDAFATDEDTPLAVTAPGLLANDSDVDGDPLSTLLVTGPTHGTLALSADGSFTYTPAANYHGPDSFTYKVSDGPAQSNLATVSLTIASVNDVPVANRDSVTTNEDTAVSGNVLANDTDADGDALTATLLTGPAHGSLAFNPDGSFLYTPSANFNGTDSFLYRVSDGQATSSAGVSITVTPVNDAPVARNDAYTTTEDTPLAVGAPGVLANDSDVDGDAPSALLVTGPSHGTLALNANGAFTYTPGANFNGSDSFTYKVNDGAADSNLATVNITVAAVNDAPAAQNDSYALDEDTVLTVAAPGVLSNDSDVDGPALAAVLVGGPAHGTLALNADGSFVYTPAANFNGSDSFTYAATDGSATSSPATVSLTVRSVNDAPVARDDAYTVAQHSTLTIPTPGVLGNDTDADNDPLSAALVTGPSHGSLTLNTNGSFTYTPAADYNGPDAFTYKAGDGTAQSNLATVSLTVTEVNNPPAAGNDAYTTAEDTPLTVAGPGVLANDADPESSPITAVLVSGPAHGTLTLNSDGSFTYSPAANFNGTDSFSYRAGDGVNQSDLATVSLTVTPVNDTPVAANDAYSTDEDTPLNVTAPGVLGNDSDADGDGDALAAALVTGPSHGTLALNANGSFTYVPAANYNGPDAFTYRTSDGQAASGVATVAITVAPVNDAPVAAADAYTTAEDTPLTVAAPGVLANDGDVDGTALSAVLVSGPTHGTLGLNGNGALTYTPAANFNGTDAFTYRVSDGTALSNVATVTITVTPVNDAPVARPDAFIGNEDTPITGNVLTNDSDADGDTLTAALSAGPSHGSLTLNSNGSFTYTPAPDYFGPDEFSYVTTDGVAEAGPTTVALTVNSVDDAPVAGNDAATTAEDTPVTGDVLANDSDVDSATLTAVLVTGPSHGTLTLNADGTFTYTPAANYNGADSFAYRASDGSLSSNPATVSLTVTPVNDVPTIAAATFAVPENSPAGTAVGTAHGADVDGDVLTYKIVGGTGAAAFSIDPVSGLISVADASQLDFETTPTFDLDVRVADPSGGTADATFTVNLTDVDENALHVTAAGIPNTVVRLKKNDTVSVVIYSSATFDARQVDLDSLRFGRTGTEAAAASTDTKGKAHVRYTDDNHDGRTDVVVDFDSLATGLRVGDTTAVLTGRLTGGRSFSASVAVTVLAANGQGSNKDDLLV